MIKDLRKVFSCNEEAIILIPSFLREFLLRSRVVKCALLANASDISFKQANYVPSLIVCDKLSSFSEENDKIHYLIVEKDSGVNSLLERFKCVN